MVFCVYAPDSVKDSEENDNVLGHNAGTDVLLTREVVRKRRGATLLRRWRGCLYMVAVTTEGRKFLHTESWGQMDDVSAGLHPGAKN